MENKAETVFDFTIVVPVYNEGGNVEAAARRLMSLEPVRSGAAEVVFVDDGSTDGSAEALASALVEFPAARAMTHDYNRGYGAALKTGISAARSEVIVITDADGTYPDDRLAELAAMVVSGDCHMAVGARTGEKVHIPLVRRPAKWALGALANYLSGRRIPDLNSGLRAMRKREVQRFLNLLPDGFSFTTTITLAMLTNGLSVKYVPVNYFSRIGSSKIRPVRDTLNFLQLVIRTVMYFDPLKVFLPLSAALMAASAGAFFSSYFFMDRILDTTTSVLFIGSIQVLAIGMLADLVDKRSKR